MQKTIGLKLRNDESLSSVGSKYLRANNLNLAIVVLLTVVLLAGCKTMPRSNPGSDIGFMIDITQACKKIGHNYGGEGMEKCVSENRAEFLAGKESALRRFLVLSLNNRCHEARVFEKFIQTTGDGQKYYAKALIARCEKNKFEEIQYLKLSSSAGYRLASELLIKMGEAPPMPNAGVARKSRKIDNSNSSISPQDSCLKDVEEFKKSCYISSLSCARSGYGATALCQRQCDEKVLQYRMRCYSPNSPLPSQQPQQIIIQQQPQVQQGPNPNVCVQDGGGMYCPNHPNTRRSYPMPYDK